MSIWRGAQSAVFYYVSCAPCADARYRKKRRQEAVRGRADRDALEREMGGSLYRHPSPSSTNPHWQAEIALGPTRVRGKRKTHTADSQRGLKASAPQNASGSNIASSVDLPRKVSDGKQDSKLNIQQYQREDEELWGSSASEPPLRTHLDGSSGSSSLTRPQRARTRDSTSYQAYRNPQVSDMHPAIVTKVHSREDVAWMLQPPPVAAVMQGKQRPPRSRSDSGNSGPTASVGSASLSRQVTNRLFDNKLRAGEMAMPGLSRENSDEHTADRPKGQRHDRSSANLTTERRDFADSPSKREKRRPSPIQIRNESSDESALTVIRNPSLTPAPPRKPQPKKVASRPQLSTIFSDNVRPAENETEFYTPAETPKENSIPSVRGGDDSSDDYDKTARRSALLVKDDSLKLLQDVTAAKPQLMFNTKIFATTPAIVESKVRLPAPDGDEEQVLSAGGPEMFESWHSPEFELDQWVHEHTKREVRQRWSMDI